MANTSGAGDGGDTDPAGCVGGSTDGEHIESSYRTNLPVTEHRWCPWPPATLRANGGTCCFALQVAARMLLLSVVLCSASLPLPRRRVARRLLCCAALRSCVSSGRSIALFQSNKRRRSRRFDVCSCPGLESGHAPHQQINARLAEYV